MTMRSRNPALFAAALIIACVSTPLLEWYWVRMFVDDKVFNYSDNGLRWPSLIVWIFYLLAFCTYGYLLSRSLDSTKRWRWVGSLGLLYSLYLALFSTNHFFDHADPAIYFWAYGTYTMPLVGAWLGYLLFRATTSAKVST